MDANRDNRSCPHGLDLPGQTPFHLDSTSVGNHRAQRLALEWGGVYLEGGLGRPKGGSDTPPIGPHPVNKVFCWGGVMGIPQLPFGFDLLLIAAES